MKRLIRCHSRQLTNTLGVHIHSIQKEPQFLRSLNLTLHLLTKLIKKELSSKSNTQITQYLDIRWDRSILRLTLYIFQNKKPFKRQLKELQEVGEKFLKQK